MYSPLLINVLPLKYPMVATWVLLSSQNLSLRDSPPPHDCTWLTVNHRFCIVVCGKRSTDRLGKDFSRSDTCIVVHFGRSSKEQCGSQAQ